MTGFGATSLIALGIWASPAVARSCVAEVRPSICSITSGSQEGERSRELPGQHPRIQEGAEPLFVSWLPTCNAVSTSAVSCVIDLGRSRVELVRLECSGAEAESCRCCVRYAFVEIGVYDRNEPFRREVCGATIPQPPLVDFIGECTDEEVCLDRRGDAHPLALGLLACEIVQKMADGQSAVAFLRDHCAVNGLAWDLVIIPIEDGQLCKSRVQIIWQGFWSWRILARA